METNTESEEVTEATRRIPVQAMAALVYPQAPRRVRLPTRLIFVAAFLSATLGCATARPSAVDTESVGQLAAGPSIWHAPTHASTDLAPAFQAVEGDDSATLNVTTVTRSPDVGEADAAELPEVAPKDQGLKAGEAR